MDKEYIQNLRYKLQKRVRRLRSSDFPYFHIALVQCWKWASAQPVFAGTLEDLGRRYPPADDEAKRVLNGEGLTGDNELEHAALASAVIRQCAESGDPRIEQSIEVAYTKQFEKSLDFFKDHLVDAWYEYLDEQLDDQRAMLALLRRYKQRCEWFQRAPLFALWSGDTRRGEKLLAMNLYEYLHDQGLNFSIEPASASGEADLVASQTSDEPLIADAKIFAPDRSKGKDYLARAFQQIYRYTVDYNEPAGYLVIFKTCAEDLKLNFAGREQFTPSVTYDHKTIFFVVVDIFCHEEPASKRGVLKAVELTETDLVKVAEAEGGKGPEPEVPSGPPPETV